MVSPAKLSLSATAPGFALCASIIAVAGMLLAAGADQVADRTGLDEAATGAILRGGSTSLLGILTSVVAAGQGFPALLIFSAVGGIAAQMAFLGVADIVWQRVLRTSVTAFNTLRIVTHRLPPPGLAGRISSSICAHSPSVISLR
jgi:cation:H+ antiporter